MAASYSIALKPGGKWSACIGRGKSIRLTANGDRANLTCLLFCAPHPFERYNMPDTLKAQHTAFLTAGNILMSDQGRVLASITEDKVGWHDTLTGYTTRPSTDAKYGSTSFQTDRNDRLHNGEDNLKAELFRHGLSARDLSASLNFFSKIVCEPDGTMRYIPQAVANRSVTLRTEMDLLVVFSNTPNPLDPSPVYPEAVIEVSVTNSEPVAEDDLCIRHCGENKRAFENTWNHYVLMKGAY